MRIKITFTGTDKQIPINNQTIVNSFIHKCLGENNEYHDAKNNYSVSMLNGGKLSDDKKYLKYDNGGYIIVSSNDTNFFGKLIVGMMSKPVFYLDMKFKTFDYIQEEMGNGWNNFYTISPFIIKKYIDKKNYTFHKLTDSDFKDSIKQHIINKTKKLYPNIDTSEIDVQITDYHSNKVKKIMIHGVSNYANRCNVSVFCNKVVAEMLYNTGLGQSCGSGFGCVCKTENIKLYK